MKVNRPFLWTAAILSMLVRCDSPTEAPTVTPGVDDSACFEPQQRDDGWPLSDPCSSGVDATLLANLDRALDERTFTRIDGQAENLFDCGFCSSAPDTIPVC